MTLAEDFEQVILSPNHGGPTGPIVAVCFHSTESGGTARAIGQFFARPETQASTTGVFSDTDDCGCVEYGVTAWHSGAGSPWNGRIEGYEHIGFARFTREEWLSHKPMLDRSARHSAKRCKALSIPIRKITPAQLREAVLSGDPSKGGICSHKDITDAVPVYGGHYDPGPNFPWDYYIDRVLFFAGGATPTPIPEDDMPYTPQQLTQFSTDGTIIAGNFIARDPRDGGVFIFTKLSMDRRHVPSVSAVTKARTQLGIPFLRGDDPTASQDLDPEVVDLFAVNADDGAPVELTADAMTALVQSVVDGFAHALGD